LKRELNFFANIVCLRSNFRLIHFQSNIFFRFFLGGTDDLENLALSCQGCNGVKSIKTEAFDLVSQKNASFYNPRKDIWSEHFVWNEDWTEIIGLTAKGRVTIKTLQLNRQRVINLRKLLIMAGEHPPKFED
jgi:hypothetical protein